MSRVNESQAKVKISKENLEAKGLKEKKRPRKRFYNGYGKVPTYVLEPAAKDLNRKISRVFSGQTWNRNQTHAASSASCSSHNLANGRRNTQSGKGPSKAYPSYAIPLNFLGKDAKS